MPNWKVYSNITSLHKITASTLLLSAILFSSPVGIHCTGLPPDEREEASALWDAAIAAKGGHERLHQIKSMVISYEETVRNVFGFVVHRGLVERLYVFPDKSWGWDDGLPPPFHLTLGMLNVEKNLRCTAHQDSRGGSSNPVCGPAKQLGFAADEGIKQAQYLYLMETAWVKPEPFGVSKDRLGTKSVDVVHTRFENKRIDYYLGRSSHLPERVVVYYGVSERPTLTLDFHNYVEVDGVQMPSRQKRGHINVQLNVHYDETIFAHAPAIAGGPHAWQGSQK